MRFNTLNMEAQPDLEGIGAGIEGEPAGDGIEYAQIPAAEYQQLQEQAAWVAEQRELYEQQQADWDQQQRDEQFAQQYDPYDPEQLRQLIREETQQALGPVQGFQEQLMRGEAEERASDIIHNYELEQGEFLFPDDDPDSGAVGSRTLCRELAEAFLPEAQQQYGGGPRAAEAALGEAYKAVRAYEDAIGQRYFERRQNELRGLTRAPAPPQPVNGAQAPQVLTTHDARDERDLVSQFFPIGGGA